MSKWNWEDTLYAAIATLLLALLWAQTRQPAPREMATGAYVMLDSVPCGHLKDCVPRVRARWMTHNPLGGGR